MDTLVRIRELLAERGWTEYRLGKESGLSESTLSNIFHRNTIPSLPTLEAVCKSFGITVSQFFAEDEMLEVTPELKNLFNKWSALSPEQKEAVLTMMEAFIHCR